MKRYALIVIAGFTLVTPSLVGQTNATATTPIPEEARRHFVMGTTLFKDAKTPDDYAQVESQFKQATDLAPQWPDARYNLALAKEAAGDYSGAMVDLKIYQQFKLSDTEARTVQDKIYALEAKTEEAAKKLAADQKAVDEANKPAKEVAPITLRFFCKPSTSGAMDEAYSFDFSTRLVTSRILDNNGSDAGQRDPTVSFQEAGRQLIWLTPPHGFRMSLDRDTGILDVTNTFGTQSAEKCNMR